MVLRAQSYWIYDKMNPAGAVYHEEMYAVDGVYKYRYWTDYTWPTSNGNVVINRTNYPALTGGDTVNIPMKTGGHRSHVYAHLYCGVQAPTQSQLIHIIWAANSYITPSTSSLQANSIDSVYGAEIAGLTQDDHIDPVFWQYGMTGYLKYVLFNHITFRGTNGFFGSYNPTLSLPNFTGDTTNAFYHNEWRACVGDSVIGANSGETWLWIGSIAANQYWIDTEIDSCTGADYSSASNPASYTHIQNSYNRSSIPLFYMDTWINLGVVADPSGHAADHFLESVTFTAKRCFFSKNFGDGFRVLGCGGLKTMPGYADTSYIETVISDSTRKYALGEFYNISSDTTTLAPYVKGVQGFKLSNITVHDPGAGTGLTPPSAYKTGLAESVGISWLYIHNCLVSGCRDTTFNSTTGPFLYTLTTGSTTLDSAHNSLTQTFAASGLASKSTFLPTAGGLLSTGAKPASFVTTDYYGTPYPSSGTYYIGAVQVPSSVGPCSNCLTFPYRVNIH